MISHRGILSILLKSLIEEEERVDAAIVTNDQTGRSRKEAALVSHILTGFFV